MEGWMNKFFKVFYKAYQSDKESLLLEISQRRIVGDRWQLSKLWQSATEVGVEARKGSARQRDPVVLIHLGGLLGFKKGLWI